MKSILLISRGEIIRVWRDFRIMVLFGAVFLLLLAAVYSGFKFYSIQQYERETAQKEKREQWLNQEEKHPHMAAHFGTFAFKPKSLLSFLDSGIDNYAGTLVYLEPHKQNNFIFKPAQELTASFRFGELSVAMVLQVFVPLLIIFLCFGSISGERESGSLKLLLLQGISLRRIVAGKILAYFVLVLFILILLSFTTFFLNFEKDINGVLLLVALYAAYYLMFIILSVLISGFLSSRNSLITQISIWIFVTIITPKIVANIGDQRYPLPTEAEFRAAIHEDVQKGLDGHNPYDERAKVLESELLVKYGVDSVHKLPVNIEGILMQASEEYTSKVYDHHFEKLQDIYKNQNSLSTYAGVANPFLAIRNLSMGISGTDYDAHLNFQKQAEQYRRMFVQLMNKDMADNSKMNEFEMYKANRTLWESVEEFQYRPLALTNILNNYKIEIITLLLWMAVLLLTFYVLSKKMNVI